MTTVPAKTGMNTSIEDTSYLNSSTLFLLVSETEYAAKSCRRHIDPTYIFVS